MSVSATRTYVVERDELRALLLEIAEARFDDATCQRVDEIVNGYQEQPHLLDAHLEELCTTLFDACRRLLRDEARVWLVSPLFRSVYTLTKVRSYKHVQKFMPHDVLDVELVLDAAERASALADSCSAPSDDSSWCARYTLILWLAVLVLVPFRLEVVSESVAQRVVTLCHSRLAAASREREAAALLLARLLARPDSQHHLQTFLRHAQSVLAEECDADAPTQQRRRRSAFTVMGVLLALAYLFRFGRREELLPSLPLVFAHALTLARDGAQTLSNRHLCIKLLQRVALVYLPPQVAWWRYKRGVRSILDMGASVRSGANAAAPTDAIGDACATTIADTDVSEPPRVRYFHPKQEPYPAIERILDVLLAALSDKDTVVRWSAAKGVGRVCARLPHHFADDVVDALLLLFEPHQSDNAWHGACLAMAELARRGLLLPQRLPQAVAVARRALQFERRRANHSIGANVRDAACYVCWAFARAYDADVMSVYIKQVAPTLLCTTVYDRRAAAAALQENVGRLGNVQHGIALITRADYFTLSSRRRAYCEVAVDIAHNVDEANVYRDALMLRCAQQCCNWDVAVRREAADALAAHARAAAATTAVLRSLLSMAVHLLIGGCDRRALPTRHGSILGLARMLEACAAADAAHLAVAQLDDMQQSDALRALLPAIESKRLLDGQQADIVRAAASELIGALVRCGVLRDDEAHVRILHANLMHGGEEVRVEAVRAMSALCEQFERDRQNTTNGNGASVWSTRLDAYCGAVERCAGGKRDARGNVDVLGVLPLSLVGAHWSRVSNALASVAVGGKCGTPETRRQALRTLVLVVTRLDASPTFEKEAVARLDVCCDALVRACDDHDRDARGDVGSFVRLAAVDGMRALLPLLRARTHTRCLHAFTACILEQLAMPLGRVVDAANAALAELLALHDDELLGRVRDELSGDDAAEATPMLVTDRHCLVALLRVDNDVVRARLLRGLTSSAHAEARIADALQSVCEDDERMATLISADLVSMLNEPRVRLNALRLLDSLLTADALDALQPPEHEFVRNCLRGVRHLLDGATGSGGGGAARARADPVLLIALGGVLSGLLQYEHDGVRRVACTHLLTLMQCAYPVVRRQVATQLYEASMLYSLQLHAALSDTAWDGERDECVRACALIREHWQWRK